VLVASSLATALALLPNLSWAGEPAPVDKTAPRGPARPTSKPARKNPKLPGLVINFQERCVDLEGAICLRQGPP